MSREVTERQDPELLARRGWLLSRTAVCMAVGLIALAIRLVYLWEIRGADALSVLIGDARSYHEWALRIARGDWMGSATFYQAPLYPYFVAGVYSVFGPSLLALRLVQACIGAASCALLAATGTFLFDRRRAFLAGILLALYPVAIFHDTLIQKSVLDLFLVAACLLILAREIRSGKSTWWIGVGAILGLLCLTRENALSLILPLCAWILVRMCSGARRSRIVPLALFAAGLALVLGAVVLRNAAIGGESVLTTSQMGPNLYIGNNPGANGMYQPLVPGHGDAVYEALDARRLAEEGSGRRLSSSEVSRYWTAKVADYVRSSPREWVLLMGRKLALLANAVEIGDVDMPYAYAEWSVLLRTLLAVFHFGVLVPLAGAGLVLSWHYWRRLWIVPALLCVYAATVAVFFVLGRYRLPMVPFLVLLAVAGLPRLSRRAFMRRRPAAVGACCAALVLGVGANWPIFTDARLDQIVMMESNLGVGLGREVATREKALPHFRKAMALAPGYVEPRKRMGLLLLDMGRPEEAVAHLQEALKLETGDPDTYVGLGRAQAIMNRPSEALGWYRRALAIDSSRPWVHLQVGHCLVQMGRLPEALEPYSRAATLAPGSAENHFYFGWALLKSGSLPGAEEELKRAIQLAPSIPDAYATLADVYRLQHRDAESLQYAEMAYRLSRHQSPDIRK